MVRPFGSTIDAFLSPWRLGPTANNRIGRSSFEADPAARPVRYMAAVAASRRMQYAMLSSSTASLIR
ncbi:hypothetical protein WS65_05040 [Burkholderia anthina]|nr:hypothetical protein WS65_05040 [Burkholderia anthina]